MMTSWQRPAVRDSRFAVRSLQYSDSGPSSAVRRLSSIAQGLDSSPQQKLDDEVRNEMEAHFGHDFSQVRVHAGGAAAASAQALNANAYTLGSQVVFGEGKYQPDTTDGRKLIAHELAHVVQQEGNPLDMSRLAIASPGSTFEREAGRAAAIYAGLPSNVQGPRSTVQASRSIVHGPRSSTHISRIPSSPAQIQRDLATPEPAVTPEDQADLTDVQIRDAIRYNRDRYDQANTRLIQDIMGSAVTGRWSADDIRAIAQIQDSYGLKADGKVGADTFEFIVQEQTLEGMGTSTADCLTMFRVIWYPVESNATAGPNGTTRIRGHHIVEARFSSRCNPAEFQYRQFIAGVATGTLGANSQDLSGLFAQIPGGQLPVSDTEDGNTSWASPNYGHRDQAGYPRTDATHGENQYRDAQGNVDQRNGITYRGEDYPAITVNGLQSGTDVYLEISFRGEIRRNGRVIETKRWTDIDTTVTTP